MPNASPKITRTTCPYCGVGCGVNVSQDQDGKITVKADKIHPANLGRLCSKGSALADTLDHADRLLYPEINQQRVDWETASQTVADKIQQVVDTHGADAVAFYVSGQLSTEDYYVANKLMKGFIGSANIDTNSRLCMASAVVAHKRAFGEDLVPCSYEDLESADLIVLEGSNTAWCHPVLYQRMIKAKKAKPQLTIVLIDPRKTQTADIADLHLPLLAGSDAFLFNGLLAYLQQHECMDQHFLDDHTNHADAALAAAIASSPNTPTVAQQCSLDLAHVEQFFALFAATEKVVSVFSQGINQSSSGVDKGNALINCHLLTGRIGKVGAGPFSFTGQPNAMGGREVGGLANQLAAHMEIDNPQHRDKVQRFWQSPMIADKQGLKAVDLFQAIYDGKVKLVWIMATNPAVSLPDSSKVREALRRCETVIVSDCVRDTDTMQFADIRLPAATWGERNGTVTNSDRTISRQRPFLTPPAEAKGDWEILTLVAQKMGYGDYFPYQHPVDVFQEHANLSAFENNGERCFDLGGLSDISQAEYDSFRPQVWPVSAKNTTNPKRLFTDGKFFTANQKANFIAVKPRLPESQLSDAYPFRFNTGRVRDHWHTLTRTGLSARLSAHISEPYLELHPSDAKQKGIQDQQLVRIWNDLGQCYAKAKLSDQQQQGNVFMPMHWSDQFSAAASMSHLIPAYRDPLSGQPESKHAAVNIQVCEPQWQGFLLSRDQLALDNVQDLMYWTRQRSKNVWQYVLNDRSYFEDWQTFSRALCQLTIEPHTQNEEKTAQSNQWLDYSDSTQGMYRAAHFVGQQLQSCLFINPIDQALPDPQWLISLFAAEQLSSTERQYLLLGKPAKAQVDQGKIICSCFSVGENTIREAIKTQQLCTVEAIGECLQAGTNCGSCIPELRDYL
jgi:assimilatory nitrate reductase catalytic subunit